MKSFSKRRRRLLQGGVGALIAGRVGLASAGTGLVPSEFLAPAVVVRSAWTYYSLRQFSVDATGAAADTGNEGLAPLLPATADSGQWTQKLDWWTGNGTDRALCRSWDSDPAGYGPVLLGGRSAILIGLQIESPTFGGASESLLMLGRLLPAGAGRGLELKINALGKPQVKLWDDDGNVVSLAGKNVISDTNAGRCTLFIYLDHRVKGSRTFSIHQFESGTVVQSRISRGTDHLNEISGGDPAGNEIFIGARRLPSGAVDQYFTGSLRGLTILNFGATPPSNLSGLMEGLSQSDMQPGPFMVGV